MKPHPSSLPSSITTAAAAALGGPPVRPPSALKPQAVGKSAAVRPQTPAPETTALPEGQADARAAFTQAIARGEGASSAIGNPTFDGPPAEVMERRAKVGAVRAGLVSLANGISEKAAAMRALIEDLDDDGETLRKAEHFDTACALGFIGGLETVLASLTKPEKASGKAKAAPVEVAEKVETPAVP